MEISTKITVELCSCFKKAVFNDSTNKRQKYQCSVCVLLIPTSNQIIVVVFQPADLAQCVLSLKIKHSDQTLQNVSFISVTS